MLLDDEVEAIDNLIAYLIFLDSIQVNNLPNIANMVTAPELVFFLARQTADEAIHSLSYGYILNNMANAKRIEAITYKWRTNEKLLKRIQYVVELYDKHKNDNSPLGFLVLLIANYLLEGLYFYNGFQFFHNLASRGLMVGTDIQIKYIQRDENIHCIAFMNAINIFKAENPDFDVSGVIKDMFTKAVELELEFAKDIIGNKILGMTEKTIEDHTYYLANKRLKDIDEEQFFPKTKNPYKHLDLIASIDDEDTNRANQFEVTSTTYKSPEILVGWDKFDSRIKLTDSK